MTMRVISLFLLSLCLLSCTSPAPEDVYLSGQTMGTTYNIKYPPVSSIDSSKLHAEVDDLLIGVNQLMSTYIKDSELSRFNQQQSTDTFGLSPQTLSVLAEAKRLGELSQGMLDVTIGPLINLWGFGPQNRPETVPSLVQISQAKAISGLDKLELGSGWARKTEPKLYVDLSPIAKGFGVDQVASLLESRGITNYLVEIGGEMRVAGLKGSGETWRLAVEKPLGSERAIQRIISIGNNAIATSGDYRNYYEEDGVRYSHLIDPISGYPINNNVVSVTVVHSSSMTADGLATAFNVMGKDKALALAKEHQLAILLISKENGEFVEYTSPKFDEHVVSY